LSIWIRLFYEKYPVLGIVREGFKWNIGSGKKRAKPLQINKVAGSIMRKFINNNWEAIIAIFALLTSVASAIISY
jgi:hypothetical protein